MFFFYVYTLIKHGFSTNQSMHRVHLHIPQLLYIELSISFLIGRKCTVNFRNPRLWRHNCRLFNNHVKVTGNHVKVTGNHVVYDRDAWFLRFARFVLFFRQWRSTNEFCYLITLQWNENKIISNLVQVRKTSRIGGGISFID